MKTRKKLLVLTVSALLSIGAADYSFAAPGGGGGGAGGGGLGFLPDGADVKLTTISAAPPLSSRNGAPTGKANICHYPQGNPANVHVISVSLNALQTKKGQAKAHFDHPKINDVYAINGKCPAQAPAQERLYVISGATGDIYNNLNTAVLNHFKPIVVSQVEIDGSDLPSGNNPIMDKIADATDNGSAIEKDVNGYVFVIGSQLSPASKNPTTTAGLVVVPLPKENLDTAASEAYDACLSGGGSVVASNVGDIGHKYDLLAGCSTAQITTLNDAKTSPASIVLTESSLTDPAVKDAFDAACASPGVSCPSTLLPTITNASISGATIQGGISAADGSVSGATVDKAQVDEGVSSDDSDVIGKNITDGLINDASSAGAGAYSGATIYNAVLSSSSSTAGAGVSTSSDGGMTPGAGAAGTTDSGAKTAPSAKDRGTGRLNWREQSK